MSEINTTSIMDLPTDPTNGGSVGGNVQMTTSEIPNNQNNQNNQNTNIQRIHNPMYQPIQQYIRNNDGVSNTSPCC